MKTQFTKGEWMAEDAFGDIITVFSKEGDICDIPTYMTEAEANAKLIAAAPDLFETIIVLKNHIEQTDIDFQFNGVIIPKKDVLKYIEQAIKKATE